MGGGGGGEDVVALIPNLIPNRTPHIFLTWPRPAGELSFSVVVAIENFFSCADFLDEFLAEFLARYFFN